MTTAIDRTDVFHPVAEIFPMMSDREFLELVADIREHGLREPVWLHRDGRVIDGRNRYLACQDIKLQLETRTYEGDDSTLIEFVISLNLHRRHLNESQRAMVAARIAQLPKGSNQHAEISAPSQSQAAELVNVDRRTVQHARKVQERAVSELVARVDSGEVAVSTAAVIADASPDEQRRVAATDKKSVVQRAKELQQEKKERAAPASATKPERKQNRRPITDAFRDTAYDLGKTVERLERLVGDDRYPRNAEQVARFFRNDLLRAADLLATVIDRLPTLNKESTE